MEIGPLSNRTPGPKPGGAENRRKGQPGETPDQSRPSPDRIEISFEARARLAELADQELAKEETEPKSVGSVDVPKQQRLEQIRERIASGYYNEPEVKAKIVDRLIDGLDG